MGIFSSILGLFAANVGSSPSETPTAKARRELRSFVRYQLGFPLATVRINGEDDVVPLDLSYGGFSLPTNSLKTQIHSSQRVDVRLRVLANEIITSAVMTHNSGQAYGFAFLYKNTEALVFMQRLIEYMKCGATLTELSRESLKDELKNENWQYFRGEGPTDLLIRPSSGTISDVQMTFKGRHGYCEVRSENGRLSTAHAVDNDHLTSARMAGDRHPNADTLIAATYILLGITHRQLLIEVKPFFDIAIASISNPAR